MLEPRRLRYWIFDMDGTLTVAVHDFEAIKRDLGLPSDRPILESLARIPRESAEAMQARLDEIEQELARKARPQEGAASLLDALRQRGCRMGILTRNSVGNARVTLEACGLLPFFEAGDILGRESAPPKPEADGVHRLLSGWDALPREAVVVGDYLFDLQAGRGAGVATVYFDAEGSGEWSHEADHTVTSLDTLRGWVADGDSSTSVRSVP